MEGRYKMGVVMLDGVALAAKMFTRKGGFQVLNGASALSAVAQTTR